MQDRRERLSCSFELCVLWLLQGSEWNASNLEELQGSG